MGTTCSRPKFSKGKLSFNTENLLFKSQKHQKMNENDQTKILNTPHGQDHNAATKGTSSKHHSSYFTPASNKIIKNEIGAVKQGKDLKDASKEDLDKQNDDVKSADMTTEAIDAALEESRLKCRDDVNAQPLTTDEIKVVSNMVVQRVKRAVREVETSNWKDAPGKYTQAAKQLLSVLDEAYGYLMSLEAPIEYVIESRKSVADLVLETDRIERICETVTEIYCDYQVPDWATSDLWTTIMMCTSIIWNYTDTSEDWAERVTNAPDFLTTIHNILVDIRNDAESIHTFEEKYVLLAALGITHNLSMVDANISALREKNFTEALQPHLKSSGKEEHLAALSSLAGIINEAESEIINSYKKVVKHLMKVLKRGLHTAERRYDGWTCKESAMTIRMLGRNDANKRLLVSLGALPLLVELAKGTIQEQTEAINAIWVLSFDAENRNIMVTTEGLQVVETACDLTHGANEKIRNAADGTLWNLRNELCTSENVQYQQIGNKVMPEKETVVEGWIDEGPEKTQSNKVPGHIMISYQWNNQKTLIEIRNELHKHGMMIWMDVDNMAGSTLQAMAEAIEEADIVLLCYSQKYKNSPNCRAEAEYTFLRQKNIIPLRMERDYKPDGWLGILLGTKLFFDFSGKYDFREKLDKLLQEVKRVRNSLHGVDNQAIVPMAIEPHYHRSDIIDGPVNITHQDLQALPPAPDPVELVKKWTSDDIQNWIIKQNLPRQTLGVLSIDEIVLLLNMRKEAPESFYSYLDKFLKSNFRLIAQLVRALEEIGK